LSIALNSFSAAFESPIVEAPDLDSSITC
jgi:hypothetical protein